MRVGKSLGKLCTPALVYFWIAIITVFLTLFQNTGGKGTKYKNTLMNSLFSWLEDTFYS